MIATDRDAVVCDFAETYRIYDIEALPVDYAATLAAGLRENSRIRMKMAGVKADLKAMLLAMIADNTAINIYAKTKDAKSGRNKPKSLAKALFDTEDEVRHFETGDDFMREWEKLTHGD